MVKTRWTILAVMLTALTLAGCAAGGSGTSGGAPASGGDAASGGTRSSSPTTPAESLLPTGAIVHHDLSYGEDPAQKLDIYQPAGAVNDPIILMVHGGGWSRGDKAASGVVDNKVAHFLPAGFVFVSANYRLSPQVDVPSEAADVASALAYVQHHATAWGGSAEKVVLMGHSAGANLVSLVAANPSYVALAAGSPWLGTVALDSAAYNVPQIMQAPHLSLYDPIFDHNTELQQQSSPTLQLSGTPAPMLLVCGTGRADSCPQANAFATAAQSLGTRTQVYPVDLRHGLINSELGTPVPLTTAVDAFLKILGLP